MSYYMCPICRKIYNGRYLNTRDYYEVCCPDMNCDPGIELFEIDELMVTPIRKLHELGYFTKYCCSGHTWEYSCGGYIMFDTDWLPMVTTAPEGWYIDGPSIRFNVDSQMEESKKRIAINEAINNLVKWCDTLPAIEYD